MLGEAPGTERLGDWVDSVDNGMTLEDLANHIASSDAFQATYPNFSTNQEFAEAFLGNLMGSEDVPAALVAAAVELVVGLLNDGMTRGALALAAVHAMLDINMQGEDHPAYGDLGMVAMSLANKIAVAEHYTLNARMMDPSSSVLNGVTSDDATVEAAIDGIGAVAVEGQNFVLTPTLDDFTGGDNDDTFVAQPITQVSSVLDAQETLNPFDRLDGGGGDDTVYIYGVNPEESLDLGAEDVSNIENVVISTVGGIDADLTDWEGVEMVDLRRFGGESDVKVIVDDGATVSTSRTFGGKATIVGSAGDLSIKAGATSDVHVGSAGQTESVTVMGGASILVDNGAGKQSQTVTSVSVNGVAHNTGTPTTEPSGTFVPLTDTNGFLTAQDGSTPITITTGSTDGTGTPAANRVGLAKDGLTLTNAFTEAAIPGGSYTWNDDGVATTDALTVIAELKFDVKTGGLVFGKIISINEGGTTTTFGDQGTPGDTTDDVTEITVRAGATGEKKYKADALDGVSVPVNVAFTSAPIGKEDANPNTTTVGGGPTLTVNSDAIADIMLASTTATILVKNESMTADKKSMPEDLAITLDKYGTSKVTGKLCVAGSGSAENIMLTVAGDSWVDLNSNAVKMLDVTADAKLSLSVSKFDSDSKPDGASETLASVMVSGAGAVSMNSLDGMKKLASIDASGSSGNNSFKSMSDAGAITELTALKTAMGGSGNDTFALGTSNLGKLEAVNVGAGSDTVMIAGEYRDDGLMVDLGAGNDTFHGNAGNEDSRIDGGDGRDTLRLSADGMTYQDGDDTKSIYSNFEILDVGGGQGTYNVGRLGVDTIVVNKSTAAAVTLSNVGGGTSLEVSAEKAGTKTTAEVTYNFATDVNVAGSIIDGGTNNILEVSLMAKGGKKDTKTSQSGTAELEITLDSDLLAMSIDSGASVAAGGGVTSGHYENKVTVEGTTSALKEVKITGAAETHLIGTGLTSLEYVNASESGGGATVNAGANDTSRIRLVGSHSDDDLTVGDFDGTTGSPLALTARNVLMGNGGDDDLNGAAGRDILNGGAGADELTGGVGAEDRFVYNAASESQVSFKRQADGSFKAEGYDRITDFVSTTDKLHFSKSLHAIVTAGKVKSGADWGAVATNGGSVGDAGANPGWRAVDDDNDATTPRLANTSIDGDGVGAGVGGARDDTDLGATDLREFIGNGKGLFLTTEVTSVGGDFGTQTGQVKNSIAVINQTTASDQGTWLLIDVDKDGDFDADTDMVIFLAGTTPPTFASATDITSA